MLNYTHTIRTVMLVRVLYILLICTHTIYSGGRLLVCVWGGRVVNITQLHTRNTHNDVGACVIYISYLPTRDTQWWAYVGAGVG